MIVSLSILALAVAVTQVGLSAPAKDRFQLKGEVYANRFKIELKTATGRPPRTIRAGTYRIKVEDRARIHNFHLRGPRVNKATTVRGRTETIWTVRLRRGRYTFFCDPHAAMMRGSSRVT